MAKYVFALILLAAFLAGGKYTAAQEIHATVTINMEQLDFEARNNVATMKRDLEDYINNQKFLDMEWEGDPIPVDIQIALSGGANNKYSAKLFIIARRYLDGVSDPPGQTVETKFYDSKWSFEYGLGATLSYNPMVYNDLNTVIDYYMLMVIGFDLDTYSELGGQRAFEKAKALVNLGASNNGQGFDKYSQPGEFTRYNLVTELSDMRYNGMRKIFFSYYYDGLDRMEFDKAKAIQSLRDAIADLADYKKNKLVSSSVLLQLFFDSKAQEIATIFNGYDDKTVFSDLRYLDPTNSSLYEQASNGELR